MDFFDLIQVRQSVRAYTDQPVESEKQRAILAAANSAPSAGNKQSYKIYSVTSREALRALGQGRAYFDHIPFALVFCAAPAVASERFGERGEKLYCIQDATIACTYAQLAACALGLGSCWIGRMEVDEVRKAVGATEDLLPIAILPIGYASETPERKPRISLDELVKYG
jgi:nitroreductase